MLRFVQSSFREHCCLFFVGQAARPADRLYSFEQAIYIMRFQHDAYATCRQNISQGADKCIEAPQPEIAAVAPFERISCSLPSKESPGLSSCPQGRGDSSGAGLPEQ